MKPILRMTLAAILGGCLGLTLAHETAPARRADLQAAELHLAQRLERVEQQQASLSRRLNGRIVVIQGGQP